MIGGRLPSREGNSGERTGGLLLVWGRGAVEIQSEGPQSGFRVGLDVIVVDASQTPPRLQHKVLMLVLYVDETFIYCYAGHQYKSV